MAPPFHKSLRARLLLNLLPLAVMLVVVGGYAISLFSRLAGRMDDTINENYRSIIAAENIKALLTESVQTSPIGGTNAVASFSSQFEENLALLDKPGMRPEGEDLLRQLTSGYHELRNMMLASARPRSVGGPPPPSTSDLVLLTSQMRSELEKVRGLDYDASVSANRSVQNDARQAVRLMAFGVTLVFALSMFFLWRIGRAILRPIQALTTGLAELGDGTLREMIPIMADDELGRTAAAFNKMAGLLQEYRRSTTAEIVRLHRITEATLAAIPDPVFVLNGQEEIELRNPAANALSNGLQLERQLPAPLPALAQSARQTGQDYLPHDFAAGVSLRYDGVEKFFLPRALVMRDREGAPFGVALVLHDVTRFRLLDSAKTNLVATVSHELKSPLTSVRMSLHLLLEKTLGGLMPKQEQLLVAARDDSERLLRILNDLLDLARLEEGQGDLRREKVAPVELLQAAQAEMAPRAAARRLTIHCVAEPQLPEVSVDRQRMDHVFSNLLSNAIKYSPDGSEITLRAARTEQGGVQFSVADHGVGIPEKYQGRVFDRFFRVPGQDKNGAGLGLPIAREITVAHGGRIAVKSAPGQGSTFIVVLNPAQDSNGSRREP